MSRSAVPVDGTPSEARGDLIIYQWSELSLRGHNGVGPVATSLEPDALAVWDDRLGPLVWARAADPGQPAEPGFVYLDFGEESVLLRKMSVRDPQGRPGSTLTYALIGSTRVLTPATALALCASSWADWLPPVQTPRARRLPPVPLVQLSGYATGFEREIGEGARTVPRSVLVRLGAHLLAEPGRRLTVTGSPSPGEYVVHALMSVLEGFATGGWGFATREENDLADALPRLVFLERPPRATLHEARDRTRVHAFTDSGESGSRAGGPPQEFVDLAESLFELAEGHGLEAVQRLRPTHAPHTREEAQALHRGLMLAPGVIGNVELLLNLALAGELTAAQSGYLTEKRYQPQISDALKSMAPAALLHLVKAWRTDAIAAVLHPDVASLVQGEALVRLLRPEPVGDRDLLRALGSAGVTPDTLARTFGARVLPRLHQWQPKDCLDLIDTCARLGLLKQLGQAQLLQLTSRLTPAEILVAADERTETSRSTARLLLFLCRDRRPGRAERAQLKDLLAQPPMLSHLAERLQHQDQDGGGSGDRKTAESIHRALCAVTVGPAPALRGTRWILTAAGPTPGPDLLRILLPIARGPRARRLIRTAATAMYLYGSVTRAEAEQDQETHR
jgi:hypothetical protein